MSSKKILLVDDDEFMRKIYRDRLKKAGFEVEEEATGEIALDRISNGEHFDLVILDIYLKKMNGWDVLHAIRRWVKEEDLPVIVISAYLASGLEKNVKTNGASAYFYKPIPLGMLVQEAKRLTGRKK